VNPIAPAPVPPNEQERWDDFAFAAWAVLAMSLLAVLLTTASHLRLHTPWPQLLYLGVWRQPQLALLAVLWGAQPWLSPLGVMLAATLLPLGLHLLALLLMPPLLRTWQRKASWLYFSCALVPVFGPVASLTLMQSLGDLLD
jgi:hypothetical protein